MTAPRRLLLLGGSGQVGRALLARLGARGGDYTVHAPPSAALSLAAPAMVAAQVANARPAVVVNCAAYTRVDDAEREPGVAAVVNVEGARALAQGAMAAGARMVQLSTDYVFDGRGGAPYGPHAPTVPLGVYGRTKRDGEVAVLAACPSALVVRTAWVHSATPPNFVATAVRQLLQGATMRVVDDQVGTPTRAAELAAVLEALIDESFDPVAGAQGGVPAGAEVVPVATAAVPRPAPRPAMGVLDCHATWARLGRTPPHWRVGVRATVDALLAGKE